MQFRILGPMTLQGGAGGTYVVQSLRERRILATLLLEPNRTVSLSRLVDVLWGSDPPRTATAQVQNCVGKLRRFLEELESDALLVTRPTGYALQIDERNIDANEFQAMLARATSLIGSGELTTAPRVLRDALDLWTGRALEDVLAEPLFGEAGRLDALRVRAMETYADLALRNGTADARLADLTRWAHDNPYNERLHGQLARALYSAGRSAEALQILRDLRRRLKAELGIAPGSFARQVEQDVLGSRQQDASTAGSESTLASQQHRLRETIRELQDVVVALRACARSLDQLDLA